ncbi:MAG: heme-dependent peroxidase [Verrucomicrobiales bacterium]|jgi:chlorite dismutase|nr:heme-dependent peroxidase [Verrucomicrobiales bacterium]
MNPHPSSPAAIDPDRVIPREGWHVIHLFFHVEQAQWSLFSDEEKLEAKTNLAELVQEIRSTDSAQLLTFSMVTPKADIGFMLLTDDLHKANRFEKQLYRALGPDVLTPVYSYLSLTELSEYTTTEEQYAADLTRDEGIAAGSPEMETKLEEFRKRMAKYNSDRLYPNMPDWPVFCFYPMSKRRNENQNWYHLDYEARRKLMAGHARVGRTFAGRVRQLITGSTGLEEWEWGVTLFSHNTQDIKEIVYEMRFDEVSAIYAEFGDFYIGLQLPLDELFRRAGL